MEHNDEAPEWERKGYVEMKDADVERMRWDNKPDGYRLKVRFKRKKTEEELEDSFSGDKTTTFDDEVYELSTLLRQHDDYEGTELLRTRNDVTNKVVEAALEHALWLYCSNRFDPEDVAVCNAHVEEYRRIREIRGGDENDMAVSQPHRAGELPNWADE